MTQLLATQIDVSPLGLSESAAGSRQFVTGVDTQGNSGYDATKSEGRRRPASAYTRSEDRVLFPIARHKLIGGTRDLSRNFAIAKWAIGKHVDFVTKFRFFSRNGDKALDDQIERLMTEDSTRWNNHVAGRHRLSRFMRIQEFRRIIDGDVGVLRVRAKRGGKLQLIEGDRIRDPSTDYLTLPFDKKRRWVHGVLVDDTQGGAAVEYSIFNRGRDGSNFFFDRTIPANRIFLNGYYEREDQIRGISPISAAINSFQDVYEGIDYALAKAKVSQLFALVFSRQTEEGLTGNETPTADADGDGTADSGYTVDFGKGPVSLDLDPGDDAKFLESTQPSTQFQEFMQLVIQIALKALDIPFSFFSEDFTNFFGSRAAWIHYEDAAQSKREDNIELLDWITRWRLQLAILDGRLELPRGWAIKDLRWEFVPKGTPYWNPQQEVTGDLMAIGAGLDTPQRVIKRTNGGDGDWKKNLEAISEYLNYAREIGVPVLFQSGNSIVQADQISAGNDGSVDGAGGVKRVEN
jgi:capsid protein